MAAERTPVPIDPTHAWPRAVLHVDMDAFFASVEQLDHPAWRGRPVIVGGSPGGRGVVSAASYEARRFGIRSAMPSAQAARLCPGAVWAPPRFARYRELSRAVCAEFERHTPYVEQVSIDEAYLDVTPTPHRPTDPCVIADRIQRAIDGIGLSCSIGVAECKTVAKIASDADKPHGITVVPFGTAAAFLAPLPVEAIPGVGARTARVLRDAGVRHIGALAALDDASATQLLGPHGPALVLRARGVDPRPVRADESVKSVSNERTFHTDVRTREEARHALRELVTKVARRLRAKKLKGRTLTLKLRYADFTTRTASRTVERSTDLELEMLPVALELLEQTWTPGTGLRLMGFGASGFGEDALQLGLFGDGDEPASARTRAVTAGIDAVRARFGDDAIVFGERPLSSDEDKE